MNCSQPGCTGLIVDGYCDLCGMAPPRPDAPAAPPRPDAVAAAARPAPSGLTLTSVGTTARPTTARSRTSVRGRLGAGLVEVPPVPYRDPAHAVLGEAAVVPESRRFCAAATSRSDAATTAHPAAPRVLPQVRNAVLVHAQAARRRARRPASTRWSGCLAHGGLGWIYLARDRNVSDRWVVLKGLLNAGDEDAMAAALAERRFLAEVEHPNIVKIYNFVEHESSGYIVMEYVGGASLKQILAARREDNGGEPDPLPADPGDRVHARDPARARLPAPARAALLRLQARQRHPDPALAQADRPGRRYRLDDTTRPCTARSATRPPRSPTSDPRRLRPVHRGRTLAVLCLDFRGYQSTYVHAAGPEEASALRALRLAVPPPARRARRPTPTTASSPPTRWPTSSTASCARSSRTSWDARSRRPRPQFSGRAPRRAPNAPTGGRCPSPGRHRRPRGRLPGHDHRRRPPADDRAAERGARADVEVELRHIARAHRGSADWTRSTRRSARSRRPTRGSGARGGTGAWPSSRWPGRLRRGRVSRRSITLLPGELAPSWRSAWPARGTGDLAPAAGWYDIVSRTDPAFTRDRSASPAAA